MSDKRSFIRNFWKERKMVGAMAPSSKYLAKKMLKRIDFSTAKVIVELGPGTGVFTRKILQNLSPDGILLVFELNDSFMQMLRKEFKDPRVISSLPLANFPSELKHRILTESHRVMHPNSLYVQFQYSLNAKKNIKQFYKHVDIAFTPANFPPAFVYYCKK